VSKNTFNAGTDSTAVLHTTMGLVQHCTVVWLKYNTVYVLYGFIPVTVEVTVFTGTVTIMEIGTHGIPVVNP
jgi:hypothetical protein